GGRVDYRRDLASVGAVSAFQLAARLRITHAVLHGAAVSSHPPFDRAAACGQEFLDILSDLGRAVRHLSPAGDGRVSEDRGGGRADQCVSERHPVRPARELEPAGCDCLCATRWKTWRGFHPQNLRADIKSPQSSLGLSEFLIALKNDFRCAA